MVNFFFSLLYIAIETSHQHSSQLLPIHLTSSQLLPIHLAATIFEKKSLITSFRDSLPLFCKYTFPHLSTYGCPSPSHGG